MKRLSVLFFALVAFVASSFAGNEYEVLWTLNNQKTFKQVTDYIDASPEQTKLLGTIFYQSQGRLIEAKENSDEKAAEEALSFNLAHTKAVLTPMQYRKYLAILNATYNKKQDDFLALAK